MHQVPHKHHGVPPKQNKFHIKANKFHTNARVPLKCIKFHTNSIKFHTNLAKTQNVQKTIAQYHPICYDFINTSREGGVLIQINRKIPENPIII